ncbi:DNA replication ATP-dependent helicase/nuclease DNA2 [Drosophila tropicalis]|uniref:DNA replication ATP-dependent helicase/nuclease DNA2 n=1 Tax=Drosophila tropicalis TaxID=46794 RepID=UPI0035ABD804
MQTVKRVLTPSKHQNDASQESTAKKFKQELDLKDELENFQWDNDEDFEDFDVDAVTVAHKLDLSRWQRCVVQEIERQTKTHELRLIVRQSVAEDRDKEDVKEATTAVCHLQTPWNQTELSIGDLISLQGQWQPSLGAYVINQDHGYCVIHPDLLISGTTVTGSLFCRRKAVLQERFRGLDAGNAVMVIGTLVHELLEKVLGQKLYNAEQIQKALETMFRSPSLASMLYAGGLSLGDLEQQLQQYVEPILAFVQQYIKGIKPSVMPHNTFQGRIEQIHDIEENLWVPQLGLKGKVDVSVKLAKQKQPIPLELKTGRASFSMEHKGQLMLYQMMQSAQGQETKSGLLLYLREGLMQEIRGERKDQRSLIWLRNELAHYLTRQVQFPEDGNKSSATSVFQLPEPIYHHKACENCAYNTICCSFAQREQLQLAEDHPLSVLMPRVVGHLTEPDQSYVQHWCGLLGLEEQHSRQSIQVNALWTLSSLKRQKLGRAIDHLKLVPDQKVIYEEGRYSQSLELFDHKDAILDLTLSGFDVGEYVIVSCHSRLAIAAGHIISLTSRRLTLQLERDLSQLYAGEIFIMDKHESQSFSTFNYTNLGLLISPGKRYEELRSIVIARDAPTEHKVLPRLILTEGADILASLNKVQKSAALRALTTNSYLLIKGLPGTGKTQTLVALVRLLHLLGRSVIVTAQTHSAVDNLLLRLMPFNLPMIRLGSRSRLHHQLESISESTLTADCKSVEQLTATLEKPSIVGVTCLGANHPMFQHRQFDYCIVDEATQVLQPTVLRVLMHCKRFVLVGDPEQLPPIVRSLEARQRGADETLFRRLDSGEKTTAVLTLQYRMNRTITRLANQLTYGQALKCADDQVANARLQLQESLPATSKWVHRALQSHLEQAVILMDTQDCSERCQVYAKGSKKLGETCLSIEQHYGEGLSEDTKRSKRRQSKYTNYCEAAIVMHLLRQLLAIGYDPNRLGVIAPYRAQVELLRKLGNALDQNIEFNTVDQYQGRDKDLIIYSCAKTGSIAVDGSEQMERNRESEILEDQRRLTVAITRAKHKLIILGDVNCLQRYGPFKRLFEHIPDRCRLQLTENRMDFNWKALLDELAELMGA